MKTKIGTRAGETLLRQARSVGSFRWSRRQIERILREEPGIHDGELLNASEREPIGSVERPGPVRLYFG